MKSAMFAKFHFVTALVFTLAYQPSIIAAATIAFNCDTDPSGLQAVLNGASSGDTIQVTGQRCVAQQDAGGNPGLFTIPEGLTLQSMTGDTILEALNNPISAIVIQASNVTLDGFVIRSDTNGVLVWPEATSPVSNVSLLNLRVELVGPAQTWVHGIALRFAAGSTVSGSTIVNAGETGIYVWEGSSDVVVADNVINSTARAHGIVVQLASDVTVVGNRVIDGPPGAHGIVIDRSSNTRVLKNEIIRSFENGIYVVNSDDFLVSGNVVNETVNQHGIGIAVSRRGAVIGNRLLNAGFHGILLIGSPGNVVARNDISRHRYDGITTTAFCGSGIGDQFIYCDGNSPETSIGGQNLIYGNIIRDQRDYSTSGVGTGIWANVGSDGNCILGNAVSEAAEGGITSFDSSGNYIFGNTIRSTQQAGVLLWDILETGSVADFNLVNNNWFRDVPANGHVVLRGTSGTAVGFNFMEDVSGFPGDFGVLIGPPPSPGTDRPSTDSVISNNWMSGLYSGVRISGSSRDIRTYRNRFLSTELQFSFDGTNAVWDMGDKLGGNFYSSHFASGNPSQGGTPYTDIVIDQRGTRGSVFPYIDRYPFQSEALAFSPTIDLIRPERGALLASGRSHPVEWRAPACALVDIDLIGTGLLLSLARDHPNTGFSMLPFPAITEGADMVVQISCKTSEGEPYGTTGTSGSFTMGALGLELQTPRWPQQIRGNAIGQSSENMLVSWDKSAAVDGVDVFISVDNGRTYDTVASAVTQANFVEIQVPDVSNDELLVKIQATSNPEVADSSGSAIQIKKEQGAFVLSAADSSELITGEHEHLSWSAPFGAAYVDLHLEDVASNQLSTVQQRIPACYPYFTFEVPELTGAVYRFVLVFRDVAGGQVGESVPSGSFSIQPFREEVFSDGFEET